MEKKDILPIKPYYEQALRERVFDYSPEATRHFFHQATHREPMTLWTHFYHYWDMAQAQAEPHASQIRRSPSLYNIWMNRVRRHGDRHGGVDDARGLVRR